jgi:hypothetical protein
MKLNNKVLAAALLATITSLSALAQAPAVKDGSNNSRALLPYNRPADFVAVIRLSDDPSKPAQAVLVASHISGPVTNQNVAAIARRDRSAPVTPVVR